jgi:hypothetical protein
LSIIKSTTFVLEEREKVAPSHKLLEDVDRVVAPEDLFDADNVWMAEVFEDVELAKAGCDTSRPALPAFLGLRIP